LRFYLLDVSFLWNWRTLFGGEMADPTERRASRRFTMALPLTLRLHNSSGPVERRGETRDVSFRGLYFWTEEDLRAGFPIEFVLTLPKQITMTRDVNIHCFGRVLRVEARPQMHGVAARIERYEFLPASA
jgi:PilZ domain